MLKIAHFIPYTGTAMGGPVMGMAAYASLLTNSGYQVTVFSALNGRDGESVRLDPRVRLVQAPASAWGGFRRSPELWRQAQGAPMDLIHSHGLWTDVNRLAGDIARRRGVPHLLAPCGMLMPGALRHHGWKKVPIRLWFQDRALREVQCLHAKSQKEYDDIRRFGLRNPVAIIPNPIERPRDYETTGLRDIGPQDYGTTGLRDQQSCSPWSVVRSPLSSGPWSLVPGRRTVLFLGRLHPVKGVARLVEAWIGIQKQKAGGGGNAETLKAEMLKGERGKQGSGVGGQWSVVSGQWSRGPSSSGPSSCTPPSHAWQLVIAGPDEGGMRAGLEAALRAAGCADSVIFTGQLDEGQKWTAYEAADLFVMPSDFENFGNSIVEAVLSGLPVITTTGTPWKELPAQGAGWCVEPTVEAVGEALGAAMAMTDDARREMGRRAAALAARFSPEQAGADLIQVYEWLLGRGEQPGCVLL